MGNIYSTQLLQCVDIKGIIGYVENDALLLSGIELDEEINNILYIKLHVQPVAG